MPKKTKITIGENDIKQKDVDMVNVLMRQLDPTIRVIDFKEIKSVMKTGIVITLRNRGVIIGMGMLVPIRKLAFFCANIEDVVVEEKYRGRGLGKKITKILLKKSKALGVKFVNLTSRPQRKIANHLYLSIGFKRRKTNVYELKN